MSQSATHIEIWQECLGHIRRIIGEQPAKTWFEPIVPVSLVESKLTLEVPSDFVRQYIEESYIDVVSMVLRKVIGEDAKLAYNVRILKNQPVISVPAQPAIAPVNQPVQVGSFQPSANPGPFVYPGLHRVQINPRLNPVYSFGNFVVGDCNRIGVTAGETIGMAPGKNSFNPLFIFGGPGLGKTHLAQAIGLEVKRQHPELVVLYVSGHEFKIQFMNATSGKNMLADFIAYYMKIDVLIVDDIQELHGPGSQNAFFNVFNYLHQNGKQLVITSDRPAVELQNFEERLVSRFKWGLSIQLTAPDYKTRLAMLRSRSAREGIEIGEEALEYIATRVHSNFRELEGVLISVMAHSTVEHDKPIVQIAAEITDKIVSDTQRELNIEHVKNTVCEYFNISHEDIISSSRKRQIVQARQIAMYLSRNLISNCSLATIGAEIGGKDHATVLHSCTTVQDLMSTDKVYRKYVSDLEAILSPAE